MKLSNSRGRKLARLEDTLVRLNLELENGQSKESVARNISPETWMKTKVQAIDNLKASISKLSNSSGFTKKSRSGQLRNTFR